MAKRDYYEILGVPKDADERTIKKAYRKLARKHHPDASDESAEVAEDSFLIEIIGFVVYDLFFICFNVRVPP